MDEIENPDVSAPGQTASVEQENGQFEGEVFGGPERADFGLLNGSTNDSDLVEVSELPTAGTNAPIQGDVTPAADEPQQPREQVALPTRPGLKREGSAQPPPLQIPTTTDADVLDSPRDPPDSLTLAELRRIREGFPVTPGSKQSLPELESVYDFEYDEPRNFGMEIEEWFTYSETEASRITKLPQDFQSSWLAWTEATEQGPSSNWKDASNLTRFVQYQLAAIDVDTSRSEALSSLCYLGLGLFADTAGQKNKTPFGELYLNAIEAPYLRGYDYAGTQIQTMAHCSVIMYREGALACLLKALKKITKHDMSISLNLPADTPDAMRCYDENATSDDLWNCLTILNTLFEVARLGGDTDDAEVIRAEIAAHAPAYLILLTETIANIRWDEAAPVPISKVFLLHWKATLLGLGSIDKVEAVKKVFRDKDEERDARGHPIITASPLDYHLFRQEISSKYPAYAPPKPAFPFEPDNNSILPPLRHRQSRYDVNNASAVGGQVSVGNGSIMHQPVHIATPAPSPPPSPAGPGGKGGKKQNYQTNQMFPFLYPPLDTNSNELGGRGSTELQDALVGRKWEGSDVPASILEAAELFAKRMRATRAMKQLWKTRVDFMRHERGWKNDEDKDVPKGFKLDQELGFPDDDPLALDGSTGTDAREKLTAEDRIEEFKERTEPLEKVAEFYTQALPVLQSFVIVSLKAVLRHITDLVTMSPGRGAVPTSFADSNDSAEHRGGPRPDVTRPDVTLEQVDATRTHEITHRALTGSLLLLLKWFKVSHVLRYEYLMQLLLDSNYIPLVLKLWQTQDMGRSCHHRLERAEYNFFALCGSSAPTNSPTGSSSSQDSAAPPPINRHRRSSSASQHSTTSASGPPEIDELGYPLGPFPTSPITNFSWRNIFTLISHLRILQKLTRRKAHRSLLLVSYKASNVLKKALRVPIPGVRLYTLKLYKTQVPYCGRKWRQSNMKTITAVWLAVPAELRDDWLVGGGGGMGGAGPGDLDGTVEEALPLEQSLRALTWWWNVTNHKTAGPTESAGGFFERELEKMEGWGSEEGEWEEDVAGGGEGY